MMRAERMVHDSQIEEELNVYNPLIPKGNELSATLFIEITDPHEDRTKAVYVRGPFEATITREDVNEKWGLVMDMTSGSVFDIVKSIF